MEPRGFSESMASEAQTGEDPMNNELLFDKETMSTGTMPSPPETTACSPGSSINSVDVLPAYTDECPDEQRQQSHEESECSPGSRLWTAGVHDHTGHESTSSAVEVSFSAWSRRRFKRVRVLQEAPRSRGHVELVEDRQLGCYVAMKVMPLEWVCGSHEAFVAAHPEENEFPWRDIAVTHYLSRVGRMNCTCEFLGLFLREAADNSGTQVCMAMTYCAGGDLFSWLNQHPASIPTHDREDMLRPVLRRVFEAVKVVHDHRLAHGDISLENVLIVPGGLLERGLTKDGVAPLVHLIDFAASTGPCASGVRGKPSYQAPEMLSDQEYDAQAADMFSLGVVVFTLIAGNYPWKSTKPHVCPLFRYMQDRGFHDYLTRRKLKAADGSFTSLSQAFSPELCDFVVGLVAVDGRTRLTIDQALESVWLSAVR